MIHIEVRTLGAPRPRSLAGSRADTECAVAAAHTMLRCGSRHTLGRSAARRCAARALGVPERSVTIDTGPCGEPIVRTGAGRTIELSISHSARLAVAAASSTGPVGIDLERVRATDVQHSEWAFSRSERQRIARLPVPHAGLWAWSLKEAAWKAWRLGTGPEDVCLTALRVTAGGVASRARATSRLSRLLEDDAPRTLYVRARPIEGPDGSYVLSLARAPRPNTPAAA
jgi:phosphopantetheinyl transferase